MIASIIASGSSERIEWLLRSNTRSSEPGISRCISSENSTVLTATAAGRFAVTAANKLRKYMEIYRSSLK